MDSLPAEPQEKPKNIGLGSLSLIHCIFLNQELNCGLLHCRQILYQLSYQAFPDILEWEVKWVLRSIIMNKPSGGDGIPAELFQILKDDSVKMLPSICQQIWKTQQRPQDWKRSLFIPIPKKTNAKECLHYCIIAFLSHASKVMLKSKPSQYMKQELPDVQAGFRKGRETRDQIANICRIIRKAREFQINIYFCFTDYIIAFV